MSDKQSHSEPRKLLDEYLHLQPGFDHLFVVPLIGFNHRNSSYLYLLYKDMLESQIKSPSIASLSALEHYRPFLYQIKGKKNVWHYHWLEVNDIKSLVGMIWKLLWISLFMQVGGKVVWTVHNKQPHSGRFLSLNYQLMKYMAKRADRLHLHCDSSVEEISTYLGVPKTKFFVFPHPVFPAKIIKRDVAIDEVNARHDLDIKSSNTVFLMFGGIARYKGIKEVIEIFRSSGSGSKLVVAGPVKAGEKTYFNALKKAASNNDSVRLIPEFISDEDTHYFLNAADYVLHNHEDILVSGSVELARSYHKKVILPKKGCYRQCKSNDQTFIFDDLMELQILLHNIFKG